MQDVFFRGAVVKYCLRRRRRHIAPRRKPAMSGRNATVKERANVENIHLGTLVHTRVSAFLVGLCPDRSAAMARLAVAWSKRFPEAAVPPTNALSPAIAGSAVVWGGLDGEASRRRTAFAAKPPE